MQEGSSFAFWKDAILLGIAVYAALLSTFNLWLAFRKDKRTLRVKIAFQYPIFTNGELAPALIEVRATNHGHRGVMVTHIALELPNKSRLWPNEHREHNGFVQDTKLPITLSDGESASAFYSCRAVGAALLKMGTQNKINVIPVCDSSTGGTHKGPSCEVDPAEWTQMAPQT